MKNSRFWSKVKRGPGCWEWQASLASGYGTFSVGRKSEGNIGSHRFVWELGHDTIPSGLCVLHKCDNRKCVRPSHLFLGTKKDNAQDAMKKNRHTAGKRHPKLKLSDKDVMMIRSDTRTQAEIAKEYNVSRGFISLVKHRKRR